MYGRYAFVKKKYLKLIQVIKFIQTNIRSELKYIQTSLKKKIK
jgi:hypothetical protein